MHLRRYDSASCFSLYALLTGHTTDLSLPEHMEFGKVTVLFYTLDSSLIKYINGLNDFLDEIWCLNFYEARSIQVLFLSFECQVLLLSLGRENKLWHY